MIFPRKSGHNEGLAGGAGIELERLNPIVFEGLISKDIGIDVTIL